MQGVGWIFEKFDDIVRSTKLGFGAFLKQQKEYCKENNKINAAKFLKTTRQKSFWSFSAKNFLYTTYLS